METLLAAINEVLAKFALIKKVSDHLEPYHLIFDSLDQMHFLVLVEETLGVVLDDVGPSPLDLSSRSALADSIAKMLEPDGKNT